MYGIKHLSRGGDCWISGYHPKAYMAYIRLDMAIFWSHAFVRSCGSRLYHFIYKGVTFYSNASTWQIDNCTLEDCLDQFTAPEWVANVKCSHCAHLEASQALRTQLDISKMTTSGDQSLAVAIEVGHCMCTSLEPLLWSKKSVHEIIVTRSDRHEPHWHLQ